MFPIFAVTFLLPLNSVRNIVQRGLIALTIECMLYTRGSVQFPVEAGSGGRKLSGSLLPQVPPQPREASFLSSRPRLRDLHISAPTAVKTRYCVSAEIKNIRNESDASQI